MSLKFKKEERKFWKTKDCLLVCSELAAIKCGDFGLFLKIFLNIFSILYNKCFLF